MQFAGLRNKQFIILVFRNANTDFLNEQSYKTFFIKATYLHSDLVQLKGYSANNVNV